MSSFKESFEIKIAGSIAAGALDEVAKIIKPGISTDEIDKVAMNLLMTTKLTQHHYFIEDFKILLYFNNHVVC